MPINVVSVLPLLWLATVCAGASGSPQNEPREEVEAKIGKVFTQMRDIQTRSPFTEPDQRQTLERIVDDPVFCQDRSDNKYCQVYEEVLKKKTGLRPESVFAAFTAEEIIRYKLLGNMTGCTGDARVFYKFAGEVGLRTRSVGAAVSQDYYHACYANGQELARMKPWAHLNGHAAIAVGWGGKWHLLNSSDYDGPRYARLGPDGPELAVDRPEDFLGREVYFGFPNDPYVVTVVKDAPDSAHTYLPIERSDGDACRFAVSTGTFGPWTSCRFEGQTKFADGVSLDFNCGRCFVHKSRMQEVALSTDAACSVTRHENNGRGDIRDCVCVNCADGKKYAFYAESCE